MRNGMRERSLARMEDLVAHYANREGVLAVVAFGSNAQRERFDDSSDLDFLVLVTDAAKPELLRDVQTLGKIAPVDALQVQYGDAVTLLFSDGVLCDFGIVTPQQLTTFPHGAGRVLWKHPQWAEADLSAREPERPTREERATDALFHLYTGLMRVARGEEAAALGRGAHPVRLRRRAHDRDDADRIDGRRIHGRPGCDVLGHESAVDQKGRPDPLRPAGRGPDVPAFDQMHQHRPIRGSHEPVPVADHRIVDADLTQQPPERLLMQRLAIHDHAVQIENHRPGSTPKIHDPATVPQPIP